MRALRGLLAAGAMAAVMAPAGAAGADAPVEQGWWTSLEPGGIPGEPSLPAPPDVPAKGLLVEGGAGSSAGARDSGPVAFSALVYQLGPGASARSLTVQVAPQSATTPDAILQLCPLTTPAFAPEQGGPSSDAPAYDCGRNSKASPSANGARYTFDVAPLAADGTLAVALLPTSPTDRVVLDSPDASSLAVTGSPVTPVAQGPPAPAPGGSAAVAAPAGSVSSGAAPSPGAAVTPTASGPATPQVASSPTAPGSPVPPASAPPGTSAGPPSSQPYAPISSPSTGGPSALTVAWILAAAVGGAVLWGAAGRAAVKRALQA
ncbi:MAG TPA: hypothetical protein VFP54_06480 [Acidimicrobiales bacterium]|nr:hypothetical protein [Acidimicrobiales bacterium]